MTWYRPTLQELIDRIQGDAAASLGEEANIPGTRTWFLARVWAGVLHYLHGYQEAATGEILPTTSTELGKLPEHAALWGIARLAPVAANVQVTVTWTAGGSALPAGTLFLGADGMEYLTDALTADPGGPYPATQSVAMTCQTAGSAGNRSALAVLTLASPIAGITDAASVSATNVTGSDQETVTAWRDRILERSRGTPQGGSAADWVGWAKGYGATVTEAWATDLGLGAVRVLFTGSAVAGTLTTYLQALAERPVTMTPTAVSAGLTATTTDITGHLATGAVQATVEAAITAELDAMAVRDGAPSSTIRNSAIRTAIGQASGLEWYTLDDVDGDGTGLSDVTTTAVQVHTFSAPNFTWV